MIKVLGPRILVKLKDKKSDSGINKTNGGIVIPSHLDLATEDVGEEVVAVGDEVTKIKVGDKVLREPRTGVPYESDGKKFLFLYEHNIQCVF